MARASMVDSFSLIVLSSFSATSHIHAVAQFSKICSADHIRFNAR
jgi:hypothetical protein